MKREEKKSPRKIKLSKETVRQLSSTELLQAAGGMIKQTDFNYRRC